MYNTIVQASVVGREGTVVQTTYSEARAKLAELGDRVTQDRETVIIKRRGAPDVALIAADELASLRETAYLLRSPANAARLLAALEDARAGKGQRMPIEELRREVGLGPEA
ncbi:MAG: type II toxin-antitoxin system prevent-host-death family antitoxin [Chloroflexi bacterium]|nr:type II toxin-antitoxin system prevent-host-death family antitoxin [Chloroflexota bacterium]